MRKKQTTDFTGAHVRYTVALPDALASVVRWQWYQGPGSHPQPLFYERRLQPPPLPIEGEAPSQIGSRDGFDAQGRLRIGQSVVLGKLQFMSLYLLNDDGSTRVIGFSDSGQRVHSVMTLRPSAERPTQFVHDEADKRW